jgi:hypothetical protein
MLSWLSENIGTIIVALVLLCIIAAIIRKLIKDKKSGRKSCGCGCENCAMHGHCNDTRK